MGQLTDGDIEALMTPEQREEYRQRKARDSKFMRSLSGAPAGSNADEWHLYLSENTDALPMVAVQIAEAIEAAEARIWSEFVSVCEAIEAEAEQKAEQSLETAAMYSFYRGQRLAAKSIRRSVEHPKYRR